MQTAGLEMAVKCGVISKEEACVELTNLMESLKQIINHEKSNVNETDLEHAIDKLKLFKEELAESQLEASKEIDDMNLNHDIQKPILDSIKKVHDWQNSLPPQPHIPPTFYGMLPTSPTPSLPPTYPNQNISLEVDSGCPGSDRSTLWFSNIQSRRVSPNSKTKSRENLGTPLYNVEEEKSPISAQKPIENIYKVIAKNTKQSCKNPEKILSLNNQYVSNITIEEGVALTSRAESELRTIQQNQYRNLFRDQIPAPPAMTSTPIKQHRNIHNHRASYSLPASPHTPNFHMRRPASSQKRPASRDMSENTNTLIQQGFYNNDTDMTSDDQEVLENYNLSSEWIGENLGPSVQNFNTKNSSKCLFPEQTKGNGHSQILSQQIDNEILELRNFFEDHREEMISLLHGPGEEIENHNRSLPTFYPDQIRYRSQTCHQSLPVVSRERLKASSFQSIESERSTPDLPDPAYFLTYQDMCHDKERQLFQKQDSESDVPDKTLLLRKKEFEKRRLKKERHKKQLDQQGKISLKNYQPECTRIQSLFPLDRQNNKEKERLMRKGSEEHFSRNETPRDTFREAWTDPNESILLKSPRKHMFEESDSNNPNFVPRLNLQDLCSDITAPSQSIDYSFQSSEQKLNHFNQTIHQTNNQGMRQNSHRSIACDTFDLDQNKSHIHAANHTTPFFSKLDKHKSLPQLPGLATCRPLQSDNPATAQVVDIHTLTSGALISASPRSVIVINQGQCGQKCENTAQEKKKDKKSKKKKNYKQEISSLMESLDQATELALRLKKRSEDMLETLNSDIVLSRRDKTMVKGDQNSTLC